MSGIQFLIICLLALSCKNDQAKEKNPQSSPINQTSTNQTETLESCQNRGKYFIFIEGSCVDITKVNSNERCARLGFEFSEDLGYCSYSYTDVDRFRTASTCKRCFLSEYKIEAFDGRTLSFTDSLLYGSIFNVDAAFSIHADDTNLALVKFSYQKIRDSSFSKSRMRGASFDNATIINTHFKESRGVLISFEDSELTNVYFTNSQFPYADFRNARLESVTFENVNLQNADFSGASGLNIENLSEEQTCGLIMPTGYRKPNCK